MIQKKKSVAVASYFSHVASSVAGYISLGIAFAVAKLFLFEGNLELIYYNFPSGYPVSANNTNSGEGSEWPRRLVKRPQTKLYSEASAEECGTNGLLFVVAVVETAIINRL